MVVKEADPKGIFEVGLICFYRNDNRLQFFQVAADYCFSFDREPFLSCIPVIGIGLKLYWPPIL